MMLGPPPQASVEHIRRKWLDVAYASVSPSQRLDLYLPDGGEAPYPVIVSFHGGAFMGGDKRDIQVNPMLEGLTRNFAVAAANYRLSGEAGFPALVHDGKAAVRWVRAHAAEFGLDAARIAAWGGSAGGYLSVMLGTSAGIAELEDLSLGNPGQPCHVQAVVDWFGPTDFLKMDEQLVAAGMPPEAGLEHNGPLSPESLLLRAPITEVPEKVRAANPETYIREGSPPFLIQHGTRDAVVPAQQSVELAARLRRILGEEHVTLELLEGYEHGDPRFEAPENVSRVLDFLEQKLT
jgi:acetyl esterase/lipase